MDDVKGREFQIAEQVADLIDSLKPEQQRQVMAMLATRYALKLTEIRDPGKVGFRNAQRKRRFW